MLPIIAALLLSSSSPVQDPPEAVSGIAWNFGLGVVALAQYRLEDDADGLVGIPFEVAMVQHADRIWAAVGLSWMFGTSAVAIDSRNVNANLFGLHADLGYSVLAYKYADVKLGIGLAMRYASVDREDWTTGMWGGPVYELRGGHQNKFLATGRATASLLLHSPGGSGGLELIPLRIEYGPSMFQFAPALSFSKFF